MKIAVVTVHDSANFGSFLQAYALKKVLEERGHSVYFVKTRDKEYVKRLYYGFTLSREAVFHPFSTLKGIIYGRKKYLIFKEELKCFSEIEKEDVSDCDVAVLGSDEIWNVKTPVFTDPIFYGQYAKRAVAYAVSSGKALPSDFDGFENLKEMIRKIPSPLARDAVTAECIEKITGKTPLTVCDPTLLADKSVFVGSLKDDYLDKHRCLVLYAYALDVPAQNIIKAFAKSRGLKVVSAGFGYSWCDHSVLCSPLDFCAVMEKAECVITTTFHGTVFSVINHKKFVSVPLSQKTTDILKRLGLEDRILDFKSLSEKSLEEALVNFDADYDEVDKKIKDMRDFSRTHLFDLLEDNNGNM